MTQQIATSTIWTYTNVIQHKSLSCHYLKITRALKNKRTLLLLYTSSWHTNIYEWSVKFVHLLLPAVSLYKEHAKCNKKVINQTAMLSIWNWKELSHVIYQNSVGTATKHEKTVYSKQHHWTNTKGGTDGKTWRRFKPIAIYHLYISHKAPYLLQKFAKAFFSIGHLHDDVISLLRPESFRALLYCVH